MLNQNKIWKILKENKFYQTILFIIGILSVLTAIGFIPESFVPNPIVYYVVYWIFIISMIIGIYLLYHIKWIFSRIYIVIISPIVYYVVISGIVIGFDPSGAYYNWKFLGWYLIIILLALPFELLLILDYFTKSKYFKRISKFAHLILVILYLFSIIFAQINRGIY